MPREIETAYRLAPLFSFTKSEYATISPSKDFSYLPISIVSPMSTGLGIVISFLAALLLYKERYSKKQKIGVLIGAAAVVLFALK